MSAEYPIRIDIRTAEMMKDMSLTHDADGKPTESYDSIIRRAIAALDTQQRPKQIDVSRQ
jgi:hypothetical protein